MSRLAGKRAVVTGASRGIGLAIAQALEQVGAEHVVRMARSLTDGTEGRRTDVRCDVTQEEEVDRAVERIVADTGVPDIVVNNAGAFLIKPLVETTAAELLMQVEANLFAAFYVMRAFLPHFLRRRAGHFVTIGSVADHRAFADNSAYGASKFGLRGLHEMVRAETEGSGVRLTLVSPGATDTALWDPMQPEHRQDVPPRDAMLHPEDVAEAVLFAVTQPPHVGVEWIMVNPIRGATPKP